MCLLFAYFFYCLLSYVPVWFKLLIVRVTVTIKSVVKAGINVCKILN